MPGINTVVMFVAFDEDDHGQTIQAFAPLQASNADEAIQSADRLASEHAGAVAWTRSTEPAIGEMGEPVIIFQRGHVGDFN